MYSRFGLFIYLLFIGVALSAQKGDIWLNLHVPMQIEFQRARITFGPERDVNGTALNFGMGATLNMQVSNQASYFLGLSYFRERFALQRPYDYHSLNNDFILSIVTITTNYDYHQLRLPIGADILFSNRSNSPSFGIEYDPSFEFLSSYNSDRSPYSTKNKRWYFTFFSHEILASLKFPINKRLSFAPYIRLFQSYAKDAILYEDPNQHNTQFFNSIGVNTAFRIDLYQPRALGR